MNPAALWSFLPKGYLLTVAVEAPVLLLGLSGAHPPARRLFAGLWLTACTYPIVVLVLPILLSPERGPALFLITAETFAPVAECTLFALAFHNAKELDRRMRIRDLAVITLANLLSFGVGEALRALGLLTG